MSPLKKPPKALAIARTGLNKLLSCIPSLPITLAMGVASLAESPVNANILPVAGSIPNFVKMLDLNKSKASPII